MMDHFVEHDADSLIPLGEATLRLDLDESSTAVRVQPSRFVKLRRRVYVARSLTTKLYPDGSGANRRPIFEPTNPRLFRRAYAEVAMQEPFRLDRSQKGLKFFLFDRELAWLEPSGCLHVRGPSPINLSPTNVRNMGGIAFGRFIDRLAARYAQLIGHQDDPEAETGTDDRFFRGAYRATRTRMFARMASAAMKEFCAAIDPARLRVLRCSYLTGEHFRSVIAEVTAPERGHRWCQALEAYPLLIYWILAYLLDPDAGANVREDELFQVVSTGLPLVPYLAKVYRVPESAVRVWRGVTLQRCGRVGSSGHSLFVRFVWCLPQHLRPRRRADFVAAYDLMRLLCIHDDACVDAGAVQAFTRGLKLPLHRYNARIGDVHAGFRDVSWLCEFGEEDVLRFGFVRLEDLVQRYHRAHQRATKEAAMKFAHSVSAGWPGIIPGGSVEVNGRLAIELTTSSDLLLEGLALKHCVADYHHKCYAGDSRIVSLRSLDGKEHTSTIELQLQQRSTSEPYRLTIVQHYGCYNSPPSKTDVAAAKSLLKLLMPICRTPWDPIESAETIQAASAQFIHERMQEFARVQVIRKQGGRTMIPGGAREVADNRPLP